MTADRKRTTPFFLNFVEEFGSNPDYADYVFGRVEVWEDIEPETEEEPDDFDAQVRECLNHWPGITPVDLDA